MDFTGLQLDSHNEECCLFLEDTAQPLGEWDQLFSCTDGFNLGPPLFLECSPFPLAHQMSPTSNMDLNDFEEIADDLGLWDLDDPPLFDSPNPAVNMHNYQYEGVYGSSMQQLTVKPQTKNMDIVERNVRYKSSTLQMEDIQKYFDVPITRAAKELNIGLTVLKKRCRELNITRWPHRKIKSLKSLINNVKVLGLTNEIEMLEEHKRMVERIPEMELTERTKKLRQACFKANYKRRRSLQQAEFY